MPRLWRARETLLIDLLDEAIALARDEVEVTRTITEAITEAIGDVLDEGEPDDGDGELDGGS